MYLVETTRQKGMYLYPNSCLYSLHKFHYCVARITTPNSEYASLNDETQKTLDHCFNRKDCNCVAHELGRKVKKTMCHTKCDLFERERDM